MIFVDFVANVFVFGACAQSLRLLESYCERPAASLIVSDNVHLDSWAIFFICQVLVRTEIKIMLHVLCDSSYFSNTDNPNNPNYGVVKTLITLITLNWEWQGL